MTASKRCRTHIARRGRNMGAIVRSWHAAPMQSRKQASAGSTRDESYATASVVSPPLADGCFSPAMQKPSRSRRAASTALLLSLRHRPPTSGPEQSSRLDRPRDRFARNPIVSRQGSGRVLSLWDQPTSQLWSGDDPIARARLRANDVVLSHSPEGTRSCSATWGLGPSASRSLPRGRGAFRMAAARAVTGLTRPADMACPEGLVRCVRRSRHGAVRASGVKGGRAGSPSVGSSSRCAALVPAAKQASVGMGRDR